MLLLVAWFSDDYPFQPTNFLLAKPLQLLLLDQLIGPTDNISDERRQTSGSAEAANLVCALVSFSPFGESSH